MKRMSRQAGFSLIEVIAISAVLVALVYFLLAFFTPHRHGNSHRIKCVSNLKNIGLAARIYATDNNDQFPGAFFLSNSVDLASMTAADYFRMLSNELSTPKIILCPSDENRPEGAGFKELRSENISYFTSLTAQEIWPQTFLAGDRNVQVNGERLDAGLRELSKQAKLSWSKAIHIEQGNVAMGDGSVQQYSSARLQSMMQESEVETNLVLVP